MVSKIKRLIKKYNKKISLASNELKELAKNNDYEAYMALFNKIDIYIEVVIHLKNIIK